MSYKMKHVYCHLAKVISSFMNMATKNFKDTSVRLLSCTSESRQASLPPRQKLQTNVLNAWIETLCAPSRLCGNGMTPAAHRPNYSRLPSPVASQCTEVEGWSTSTSKSNCSIYCQQDPAALLLLWMQCIHFSKPHFKGSVTKQTHFLSGWMLA